MSGNRQKLGFIAPVMQAFTSIGPMLDIVALFSVIAIISGAYLPVVMFLAFIVGFSTLNTTYRLSGKFVSNGGYYSYVGKVLGKSPGIFVGLMYLAYAMLVLPNISLFYGGFISSFYSMGFFSTRVEQFIISIVFSSAVILFVSFGLKVTFRYTVVAGILEFLVVGVSSLLFISHPIQGLSVFTTSKFNVGSIWLGLIFGIVAFAGSGSPVFFSDNVDRPSRNIPRSIFASYTISGTIMIIASLSLVLFLGNNNLSAYTSDPYVLLDIIRYRLGTAVYVLFTTFAVMSGINLTISYLNALKNGFSRMAAENLFGVGYGGKFREWHILVYVAAVSFVFETVAFLTNDFFYVFSAIAGTVGLLYIVVHVFSNIALIRVRHSIPALFSIILPLLSTSILLASFYYSAVDPTFSLLPSNVLFAVVAVTSLLGVIAVRRNKSHFHAINIETSEKEVPS